MSAPFTSASPAVANGNTAIVVSNARRWTIVWLLFAASLINYFDRQTLAFALPLLSKDFQLNAAQQGLVVSAFFWTYTYLQIPIGLCADRFNLRWLYAGAFVIWVAGAGVDRVRQFPRDAHRLPHAAGNRRVHLSGRWHES